MDASFPNAAQLQSWRAELSGLCRQKLASPANELPLDLEKRIRVLAFILRRYDAIPPEFSGQIDLGHDPAEPSPPDVDAPAVRSRYDWDRVRIPPTEALPIPYTPDVFDSGRKLAADKLLFDDLERHFGRETAEHKFEAARGYQIPDAKYPSQYAPNTRESLKLSIRDPLGGVRRLLRYLMTFRD